MNLPLFSPEQAQRAILWRNNRAVCLREFWTEISTTAAALPEQRYLLNLCETRAAFMVAYCAALLRGQTTILPSSRAKAFIEEIAAAYPDSHIFTDTQAQSSTLEIPWITQELPATHLSTLTFTSGSTGKPQPHGKSWRAAHYSAQLNSAAIRAVLPAALSEQLLWLVATVPSQHMYGVETCVWLPLLANMALHVDRPLFPTDIARALREVPEPRVLISTPFHLKAIVESGVDFPAIAAVVCATAPLQQTLAAAIERQLQAPVIELFGATETCVIASRRTAQKEAWHTYIGVNLETLTTHTRVCAPWLDEPVLLQDIIEVADSQSFLVKGRNADLIDIAGKRASLADLTQRLLRIPGVIDATVFQPELQQEKSVSRLAALVVAPTLDAASLSEQVARHLDPVFMPRPLLLVPELPRNEVGKLPRERLWQLLQNKAR